MFLSRPVARLKRLKLDDCKNDTLHQAYSNKGEFAFDVGAAGDDKFSILVDPPLSPEDVVDAGGHFVPLVRITVLR